MAGVIWWLPERKAQLAALVAEGLSYAEIARRLTQETGRNITRLAVASLCRRLALHGTRHGGRPPRLVSPLV